MGVATYRIVPHEGKWAVSHDGDIAGPYLSREAALEAALPAASLAIKEGHAVEVFVPAPGENVNVN